MYDPQRDPHHTYTGAAMGIWGAFVPRGTVGILGGIVILLLLGVVSGTLTGAFLFLAIGGIAVLLALIPRAIKAEIRREDQRTPRRGREGSLPDDSNLSDEERRRAMRGYDDDRSGL